MSDTQIVLETVRIIEVGLQGPPGPQGESGESGTTGTTETKTSNFPAASSGVVAYRCKGTITCTLPTFASADADILLEFRASGNVSDAISFSANTTINGVSAASITLGYKDVLRLRKGETEWEVWG